MEPKISIVVPIYNMERYLPRCLDSLIGQSIREIEIVAVNDGSSDGSLGLLRQYAERDPRIVVIDGRNQGVAAARNIGLSHCTGEFIGFVDPDDWADRGMYENMLEVARQEDADIVMCAYVREFGGFARPKTFEEPDYTVYRGEEVQSRVTRRLIGPIGDEVAMPENLDAWGTVWSKLYRAELLEGVRFTDLSLIGSNEDTLFNISACSRAKTFVFLNRPYYHYWRANDASITTRYKPMLAAQFRVLYDKMEEAGERRLDKDIRLKALSNRIAMNVLGLGLNIVSRTNPKSVFGRMRELGSLLREETFRKALNAFQPKPCPPLWRLFYGMAKLRMSLAVYVMLIAMEAMRTKKPIRRSNRGTVKDLASRHRHEPGRAGNDAHELLPSNAGERHTV
ncbi:glycosyltransferase [Paenibacillus sp. LHD-117]|uniref:glycosyltransferase family 2 protein n=1 Tax=Paenibacillus sp. LHD-117 TaxID=3071412 RepID=UPI0027DF7D84|nr:glycosyltransferase [Paenibacillus sp. LHD-117]MDQ6423273.1 glycosyltransferase [Paenibacillus sp. LHD-117]